MNKYWNQLKISKYLSDPNVCVSGCLSALLFWSLCLSWKVIFLMLSSNRYLSSFLLSQILISIFCFSAWFSVFEQVIRYKFVESFCLGNFSSFKRFFVEVMRAAARMQIWTLGYESVFNPIKNQQVSFWSKCLCFWLFDYFTCLVNVFVLKSYFSDIEQQKVPNQFFVVADFNF